MLPSLSLTTLLSLLMLPLNALAANMDRVLDLTTTWFGIGSIFTCAIAYAMLSASSSCTWANPNRSSLLPASSGP
jgi:hypothetical protein